MKVLGLAMAGMLALPLHAYMTSLPSYDGMAVSADAIVIAAPVARQELPGPATVPGVKSGDQPIPAVEIRTTFVVAAVLKGGVLRPGQRFELKHFREKERPVFVSAGPMLIDFDPRTPQHYLMFLREIPGSAFEAVDRVEPGWCIEKLMHPVEKQQK